MVSDPLILECTFEGCDYTLRFGEYRRRWFDFGVKRLVRVPGADNEWRGHIFDHLREHRKAEDEAERRRVLVLMRNAWDLGFEGGISYQKLRNR